MFIDSIIDLRLIRLWKKRKNLTIIENNTEL